MERYFRDATLGTIHHDKCFTEAQIQRQTLLEHGDGPTAQAARSIWRKAMERSAKHSTP